MIDQMRQGSAKPDVTKWYGPNLIDSDPVQDNRWKLKIVTSRTLNKIIDI